jgi:hypothetical protein
MTSANAKDFLLAARQKLNDNKCPTPGRNLVLTSASETDLLSTELFVAANQRGDGGTALEEARLGRILGLDTYMDQNTPYRTVTDAEVASDGNHTAGASPGDTGNKAFTSAYTVVVGEYVVITGEQQLNEIKALTGTTGGITLNNPYKNTVAANAVSIIYKSCDVNGTTASGYVKPILLDGYAAGKAPVAGQIISFGTTNGSDRHTYTIIGVTTVSTTSCYVLLDRPTTAVLTDNDLAFPGPAGSLNLAFDRNAIALISRPLAIPSSNLGVQSSVGAYDNITMRVSMQYQILAQGTVVTFDLLFGTKVLDVNRGALMLG